MNAHDILPLPILVPLLLIFIVVSILIIHHIQYQIHEYGHVLELKKSIFKDIENYKKETETNKINIQVIKFIGCDKKKTYSDYFQYIENKKQEFKYQSIIKDIATSGYLFSKQIITHKYLWITYCSTWIIVLFTILYTHHIYVYITAFYMIYVIIIYFFTSERGYGSNKLNHKRGISDHYLYHHPKDFKYVTLEEDKENLQKEYKILLNIIIDLSDTENPKINIISKNKFYNLLTKIVPLNH